MPKILSCRLSTFCLPAVLLLVACGQKGPLYLEKDTHPAQTPHSNSTSAQTQDLATSTPRDLASLQAATPPQITLAQK